MLSLKNKKIAIIYRGFYKRTGNKSNNFKHTFLNHYEKIYKYLDNFDIYFHTYSVKEKSDTKLLNLFKTNNINVKDYIFDKDIHSKIIYSIVNSTKLVKDDYDLIINLRFDLIFLKPIIDLNIDCKKFNFLWKEPKKKWDKYHKTSDLLFIFPSQYINIFIQSLNDTIDYKNSGSAHWSYPIILESITETNINFLIEGHHHSNINRKKKYSNILGGTNKIIDINRKY